jgi:heat shock protein HspQ
MKRAVSARRQCARGHMFDCRGMIVDLDPVFTVGAAWCGRVERSGLAADRFRYQIRVHDKEYAACVAGLSLVGEGTGKPVNHPAPGDFIAAFGHGICQTARQAN